jgi:hypothetical protein
MVKYKKNKKYNKKKVGTSRINKKKIETSNNKKEKISEINKKEEIPKINKKEETTEINKKEEIPKINKNISSSDLKQNCIQDTTPVIKTEQSSPPPIKDLDIILECPCNNRTYINILSLKRHKLTNIHKQWEIKNDLKNARIQVDKQEKEIRMLKEDNKFLKQKNYNKSQKIYKLKSENNNLMELNNKLKEDILYFE